jgi:hypothetical protein
MPSLDLSLLRSLHDDFRDYPCFVETGTYTAQTILSMESLFKTLHTIEISPELHTNAKSKYTGNRIQFHLGDSSDVFQTLLPTLQDKTIFFLDGHWSGGGTGRGRKDCPLNEEIQCITQHFKPGAILIIDDFRLFGLSPSNGGNEDWSQIHKSTLLQILGSRVSEVYHLNSTHAVGDRLVIHIKPFVA